MAFAGLTAFVLRQLDKALVQAQVVSNRISPASILAPEEVKVLLKILIDLGQCGFLRGLGLDIDIYVL